MLSKTQSPKKSFNSLRVAAFESRMRPEMIHLIEQFGGQADVAPSMREIPIEGNKDLAVFQERLLAGNVDILILMTGIGTRTLIKAISATLPQERVIESLKKTTLITRGPKPVRALEEYGLKPTISVPEPNTWREILRVLDEKKPVEGLAVAVQEYGEPNRLFLNELKVRGADVLSIPIYKAGLPEDLEPLRALIRKIVEGRIDVVLFTNSTQVENVLSIVRKEGRAREFYRALLNNVVVASVGPTCSATLKSLGLPVDIEPERSMMGALVAAGAAAAAEILKKKRGARVEILPSPAGIAQPGDALHNSLFMKACRREPTPRTPIWLMRQAGRYMKEYRELRAKVSFLELCKNSDLASEVTVDAAHRLGVDAAIIFSDILIIAEPLGFALSYGKDQGPQIGNPFRKEEDLRRLKPVVLEESLAFVFEAIRKTRTALKPDIPLIGFAGAPFTLASYLIEGQGSRNFIHTKSLMYERPDLWHKFMDAIVDASIHYLNAQIEVGAQAVQLFDSWVGCLSPEDFRTFVLPHTRRLIQRIVPGAPVISFGTQTAGLLPLFNQAGGDVIGVDWRVELDEAWELVGKKAIQGNLDPVVLLSNPDEIRRQARRILTQAAGRPGHIFNLGHGVLPETPLENVMVLIEAVGEFSRR